MTLSTIFAWLVNPENAEFVGYIAAGLTGVFTTIAGAIRGFVWKKRAKRLMEAETVIGQDYHKQAIQRKAAEVKNEIRKTRSSPNGAKPFRSVRKRYGSGKSNQP